MGNALRILMITTEWPTPEFPHRVPFITRQASYLQKAGIDVTLHPFLGAKNPLNYMKAWATVHKMLRRERYDLIHAQWGQSTLPTLFRNLPLVVTFRGDDLEGIIGRNGRHTLAGQILRWISLWAAKTADEVIVVSKSLIPSHIRRNYHLIPSGLDMELFRPIPRMEARLALGITTDKPLILFSGAAKNPRKRLDLAQKTVNHLKCYLDTDLVVASDVPITQIPLFMNACNTLLLTSIHEGSPNVVKEAIACNLPVVSTNVGDVAERIQDLPGCFISSDDRPETLAGLLARSIQTHPRPKIRDAVKDLDEHLLTRKVLSVYESAIKSYRS